MSAGDGSPNGRHSVTTPTLAERVRSLTGGRRSSRFLRSSSENTDGATFLPEVGSPSGNENGGQTSMFVEKCLQDLTSPATLGQKVDAIRSASLDIKEFSTNDIQTILNAVDDLRNRSKTSEYRQLIVDLASALADHPALEDSTRDWLFELISSDDLAIDIGTQIKLLRLVTLGGRQIRPIEAKLCTFLSSTMQAQYEITAQARSRLAKASVRRSNERLSEEGDLGAVIFLARDLFKNNAYTLPTPQCTMLLDEIFGIAKKTTSGHDLNRIMATIAIITKAVRLPQDQHITSCVEILCGIAGMKAPAGYPEIEDSFRNLLTGTDSTAVADKILDLLISAPLEKQTTVIRGAAFALKNNICDKTLKVHWHNQKLLEAVARMSHMNAKYQLLGVETLYGCTIHPQVSIDIIGTDWRSLGYLLDIYTVSETTFQKWRVLGYRLSSASPLGKFMSSPSGLQKLKGDSFRPPLQNIARWLVKSWDRLNAQQRSVGMHYMFAVAAYVDPSLYSPIIEIMLDDKLLSLAEANGVAHLAALIVTILLDSTTTEEPRLKVIDLLRKTNKSPARDKEQKDRLETLIDLVLSSTQGEQNKSLLIALESLASEYIFDQGTLAEPALEFLKNVAQAKPTLEQAKDESSPSEMSSRLLVEAFLLGLRTSHPLSSPLLASLITIASEDSANASSRLLAMSLLTRIRCDVEGVIKVVENPDALDLTCVLMRPERSITQAQGHSVTDGATPAPASPITRQGRSSVVNGSEMTRSRSTTRSGNTRDRSSRIVQPVWMSPGFFDIDSKLATVFGPRFFAEFSSLPGKAVVIDLSSWLDLVLNIIKRGADWEIYSFILVQLPSQLGNKALFTHHKSFIQDLHIELVLQLGSSQFMDPPANSGMKKGDVALCLYHTLTVLIGYRQDLNRAKLEESIRVFHLGMAKWDRATRCCIHALAVSFQELPEAMERHLPSIVFKMSQIITQSHLAIDILEFLGGLARCPQAYENVTRSNQGFVRTIFGICISFIHHSREQGQPAVTGNSRLSFPSHRRSGISSEQRTASDQESLADAQSELPDYVFTLAYHVITAWFLNMEITERPQHVGWIAKGLAWKDLDQNEVLAEQSQVTLDMMHRTTYLDLGETQANNHFQEQHGRITKKSWLVGMSIITIETAANSGLTQVTKRQASGTTHSMYQPYIAPLPAHHIPRHPSQRGSGHDESPQMYPDHVLLQLLSTIAPMPIPLQPIVLPDDEAVARALRTFDMNDTVDGYKAGVIYVGQNQTREEEILANSAGSVAFDDFLEGLGTKVVLRDAPFKAQGLDQHSDRDGTHTYAWRDRVVEIVFHVPTMMPTNLDEDPQCIHKKKHIGNNFVNIIYNDSGGAFEFDTLKSQFNYVNILITPNFASTSRPKGAKSVIAAQRENLAEDSIQYFTVHTRCSPDFPRITPAATPKMISAENLASFVRQLTLTASVFSQIWSNREGGEYVSSWRNRLKEIVRLRERYSNTATSGNVSYPGMGTVQDRGGAKSYIEGDDWQGTLAMGGLAEHGQFLMSLDFTRWT